MAKKLYYKIGEACKILEIQPYVLRYWEKEFPLLSPNKSKSGQRVYNERELSTIRRIKELLYDEGYTIAGAKKKLEAELAGETDAGEAAPSDGVPDEPPPDAGKGTAAQSGAQGKAPPEATPRPTSKTDPAAAVRKMRSGLEEALSQAREILKKLESAAP